MERFTGLQYIKIDIANQFGMDKETWQTRIDWVDDMVNSSKGLKVLAKKAKDPLLFIKAIRAMEKAKAKEPTGFIMGLDATASGIQIMAALIGCHKTAKYTNLTGDPVRHDIYGTVAYCMNLQCDDEITRDMVKYPVMTTFYGSKAQPKALFGEDTEELEAFYKALGDLLPGAMELMEDMQNCWNPDGLTHKWTLPDGHVASVNVMQPVDKKVEVDELDHATFTHRVYVNKAAESGLSLAANIIHSIDGYIVREMHRRAQAQGFELLTIHDSFWSSPNYMNNVRQNYIDILAEISDSTLLQDILNEITGQDHEFVKYSNKLTLDIRAANYSLS